MDDDSGWSLILTEGWGPLVLDAVARRVEAAALGERSILHRAVTDPERAAAHDVERVHDLILTAIKIETGANLEELGSQAAWACYEQTWDHLTQRWLAGGRLVTIGPEHTATVHAIVERLPVVVAAAAGADTSGIPAVPIMIDGVLHLDAEGLFAWIATSPRAHG
ncbi:MAG: hypothetical protein ACI867_001946, partial [Glaciecola sp.]